MRLLDCLAAVVALSLLGALIASPYTGVAVPDELKTAFGTAIGWTFKGAANGVNGAVQRRRNNAGGKD